MSEGTIIKREGKRGVSYLLKYDGPRDVSGKRKQLYKTVRGSLRDAQRELRRLLGQVDEGTHVDPSRTTLTEYLRRWLDEFISRQVSPKTLERYREFCENQIIPRIGDVKLQRLTGARIDSFYTDLLASGSKRGKPLAPRTVHHCHRVLSEALEQAVRWRELTRNPAADATPPKVEDTELEILSPDEIERVILAAQRWPYPIDHADSIYTQVLVSATTGARRGEVLALRWKDVDWQAGKIRIEQTLEITRQGLRLKTPKTKRSRREITIPQVTIAALRQHRRLQAERRLALGLGKAPETALVFTTADEQPKSPALYSAQFPDLVKAAGLPPVSLHSLRHSHITDLLRRGVHVKVVSERAGHASIAVTLQIYAHVIPGMQEDVAALLDRTFGVPGANAE